MPPEILQVNYSSSPPSPHTHIVCMFGGGVFLEGTTGDEEFLTHTPGSDTGQRRYTSHTLLTPLLTSSLLLLLLLTSSLLLLLLLLLTFSSLLLHLLLLLTSSLLLLLLLVRQLEQQVKALLESIAVDENRKKELIRGDAVDKAEQLSECVWRRREGREE